jgi:WD40 repeat protein
LAILVLNQRELLLASTSADPHIRLWQCNISTPAHNQQVQNQEQQQLLQERFGAAAWHRQLPVAVGRQIQHCVALETLTEDPACVLMATGGTDSTVRLYVRDPSSIDSTAVPGQQDGAGTDANSSDAACTFTLQCQLKGHENWVKGVAFQKVQEPSAQAGQAGAVSLLLASAGQDRYGRIWCVSTDPNRINASADGAGSVSSSSAGDEALRKLITRCVWVWVWVW